MLDQLRRHAKSWVTKAILGVMAVGLIFFFGYSGLRKSGDSKTSSPTLATVNGEDISKQKFEQSYENQVHFYEQISKGKVNPALLETLKQNTLEKLIKNKLFAQQAKAISLGVSDKELVEEITANPNFMQEGVFSKQLYLDRFKPFYQRQYGEDYEQDLREDILAEKFEQLIRDSITVSNEEVKEEYLLSKTELKLQKISLDPSTWNTETKSSETQLSESKTGKDPKAESQPALAQVEAEILKALAEKSSGKNMGSKAFEALKKKYTLKVEDTGLHSLKDKVAFVGNPDAHEALACIVQLSFENPVCPEAYPLNNRIVFFKLIERKDPDWAKFAEEKKASEKTLLSQRQTLLLKQISDGLTRQASIKSYWKSGEE